MIFVPSYRRGNSAITHTWLEGTTYAVHAFESDAYRSAGLSAIEVPDALRGNIAKVRNWIVDYALANAVPRFVIIDDDVDYIYRWVKDADGKWIQKRMNSAQVHEFFELAESMASDWGIRLWGVNCATDKRAYRENTPFALKSYISGSLHGLICPETRYDESLPLKEDYDFCIQELNRTRRILRFNMIGMMKKDHMNLGGCSAYRTLQVEADQMRLLRKKWGPKIIRKDGGQSNVHRKKEILQDLNPIFRVPIPGV